jgi:ribosomal protein S18 acetylase RimI-like enzyme
MSDLYDFDFSESDGFTPRQLLQFLLRYILIVLANLPYLQITPEPIMNFILTGYKDAFKYKMAYRYVIFYKLFRKFIIIHECNSSKAGFACFRAGPKTNIHLGPFGIVEPFRGKGLSKPFLAECLQHWQKQGFITCSLHTETTNFIAINIFKSLGFKPIKVRGNLIYMSRQL